MKFSQLPHSTPENTQNYTTLRAKMVQIATVAAPLLMFLEFFKFAGESAHPRKNSNASGGRTRAVGLDYPDNKIAPTYADLVPRVFGDICQTDNIYVQQQAAELENLRVEDILAFLPDFFSRLQYALLKYDSTLGSVSNPQFDGILKLVPDAQKTSFTTAITTEAAAQQLVYEKILPAAAGIGTPTFMLMDILLLARLSAYKSANISYGTSQYGNLMPTVAGIPVVLAGTNGIGGTKALPWASGTTTKILIASTQERADLTCATWCGFDFKDQGLVGTSWKMMIEGGFAPGLLRDTAIAEIDDITIA